MAKFLFESKLTKSEISAEISALKDSYKMTVSRDKTRFTIKKYDSDFQYMKKYFFTRRIKGRVKEKDKKTLVTLYDTTAVSLLWYIALALISFLICFLGFENINAGLIGAVICFILTFSFIEIKNRIFEKPRDLRAELYDIFIRSLKLEEV